MRGDRNLLHLGQTDRRRRKNLKENFNWPHHRTGDFVPATHCKLRIGPFGHHPHNYLFVCNISCNKTSRPLIRLNSRDLNFYCAEIIYSFEEENSDVLSRYLHSSSPLLSLACMSLPDLLWVTNDDDDLLLGWTENSWVGLRALFA